MDTNAFIIIDSFIGLLTGLFASPAPLPPPPPEVVIEQKVEQPIPTVPEELVITLESKDE